MGRRPPHADSKDIYSALADLDGAIIRLLTRRARLAAEAKPNDQRPIPSVKYKAWVEIEKKLRKYWDQAATGDGPDRKLWRDIFNLVQQLPAPPQLPKPGNAAHSNDASDAASEPTELSDAQKRAAAKAERETRGFLLTPAAGPMDVDIQGPASLLQTRLWAGLLAQAEEPCSVGPVVVNDALVDCIKALDHAGGRLYWEGDTLANRGRPALACNDKVIFAGNDLLTLHMLIFLALPDPGCMKITGGPTLKNFDSTSLSHFLPSLGARLVSVIPHQRGVPLRLETAASIPDEIGISEALDEEAILGLLVAAPRFPLAVTLKPQTEAAALRLQRIARPALALLEQCGIAVQNHGHSITIQPGPVVPPATLRLDLDPLLGAALLALPRFGRLEKGGGAAGGKVRLRGAWSQEQEAWNDTLTLLRDAGLDVQQDEQGLRSTLRHADQKQAVRLDVTQAPDLFPLALTLAAAATNFGRVDAAVRRPERDVDLHAYQEFLENCGLEAEPLTPDTSDLAQDEISEDARDSDWLALRPCALRPDWDEAWRSPSPVWTLAYALAAYIRPGLKLDNPISLSEMFPRFWSLYNGLPKPEAAVLRQPQKPQRKEPDDGPKHPTRKRVKV